MKQSDLRGVIIVDSIHDILLEFSGQARLIFGNTLKKIILYGSYARGDQNEHSDIDIMILTSLSDQEIESLEPRVFDVAFDLGIKYALEISVIVKNEDHFNYWLGALPFYDNVKKEGVVLNG